eukprot:88267_1
MCQTEVAETTDEFFGTLETSDGGWACMSDDDDYIGGTNDIWGCSTYDGGVGGWKSTTGCYDTLTSAIGNSAYGGWVAGTDFTSLTEATTYWLTDAASGGVLCCIDDDVCPIDPGTFDWDTLTEDGTDIPELLWSDSSMTIDEDTLSIQIHVELEYMGYASADDYGALWGVTYVLDFEDFDAHKSNIYEPGTCQNRNGDDFSGASFDEYWDYSTDPSSDGVGSVDNL